MRRPVTVGDIMTPIIPECTGMITRTAGVSAFIGEQATGIQAIITDHIIIRTVIILMVLITVGEDIITDINMGILTGITTDITPTIIITVIIITELIIMDIEM